MTKRAARAQDSPRPAQRAARARASTPVSPASAAPAAPAASTAPAASSASAVSPSLRDHGKRRAAAAGSDQDVDMEQPVARRRPLVALDPSKLEVATFSESPVGPSSPFHSLLVHVDVHNHQREVMDTPSGPCVLQRVPHFSLDDCVFLEALDVEDLEDTLLGSRLPPGAFETSISYDHLEGDLLFTYWRAEGFVPRLLRTLKLLQVVTEIAREQRASKRQRTSTDVDLEAKARSLEGALKSATDAAAAQTRRAEQAEALLVDQGRHIKDLTRELEGLRGVPLQSPTGLYKYLTSNAKVTGHRSRLEDLLQRYAQRDATQLAQAETIIAVTALGPEAGSLDYDGVASPPRSPSEWFGSPPGSPARDVGIAVGVDDSSQRGASSLLMLGSSSTHSSQDHPRQRDVQENSGLREGPAENSEPQSSPQDAVPTPSPSRDHSSLAEEHEFEGGTPLDDEGDLQDADDSNPVPSPDGVADAVPANVDRLPSDETHNQVDVAAGSRGRLGVANQGSRAVARATARDGGDPELVRRFKYRDVPRQEFFESQLKLGLLSVQTSGYPDYCLTNFFTGTVYERYDSGQYVELLCERPWRRMFRDRVKTLFLVDPEDSMVKEIAPVIWDFMFLHQRAFWESLHWLPIPQSSNKSSIYYLRAQRRQALVAKFETLENGFSYTYGVKFRDMRMRLWCEPAFWVVPLQPCAWVPPANSHLPVEERPRLIRLAREIDSLEPVRFGYSTDEVGLPKFFEHVHEDMKRGGLERRLRNFVAGKYTRPVPCIDTWSEARVVADNIDCTITGEDGQPWEGLGWLKPSETPQRGRRRRQRRPISPRSDESSRSVTSANSSPASVVEVGGSGDGVEESENDDENVSSHSGSPHAYPRDL